MNRIHRFFIAAMCTSLVCTACSRDEAAQSKIPFKHENVLHFDVNYDFGTLSPMEVDYSGSTYIFPLLYSFLFLGDFKEQLTPDLVQDWAYEPDTLTWRFELRPDVRFHDGRPLTAKDAAVSIRRFLQFQYPELLAKIRQWETPSDAELVIRLQENVPAFDQQISNVAILPAQADTLDYVNAPVGSGPFRFFFRQGRETVILEANPDYYLGRPSLDQVVYHFVQSRESTWIRLLKGETDIGMDLTARNYHVMRTYDASFRFDEYPLSTYSILLYNTYHPLFADPRVRRALTLAIDREYMVKTYLKGFGRVCAGPMGAESVYHNPDVTPLPYDPQKALAILQDLGWRMDPKEKVLKKQGRPFAFTFLVTRGNTLDEALARFIALCLNDIHIHAKIQELPFEELGKRYFRNTDFEAVLTEINGHYLTPEAFGEIWASDKKRPSQAGGFDDARVSSLIREALNTKNDKLKTALFYKAEAKLSELQPGSFLVQRIALDIMSKRFALTDPFFLNILGVWRLQNATLAYPNP